eukprot:TRINITY_DN7880_c0_g1_i1.p1 TRINITY_DN7880_c0_g1~~TRINITY_DN7880_c0_g1_i1.p1  ORF type:complete len:575 (+),score=169.79 TRINITY_DN7880_c0_g1_i1:61-1785(+)
MGFAVLVACDLGGKCNFEIEFIAKPSVSELLERLETVLAAEAADRTDQHPSSFSVLRTQVFDERIQMWVDLVASGQLRDRCQCYAFQKETPWHRDSPGRIPPAVRPRAPERFSATRAARAYSPPAPRQVSPQRGPSVESGTAPLSPFRARDLELEMSAKRDMSVTQRSDKVRFIFDRMDSNLKRRVGLQEWSEAVSLLQLCDPTSGFSAATVEDLFRCADRDGDGAVTYSELESFAERYPKLVDCLFFRTKALEAAELQRENVAAALRARAEAEAQLDEARTECNHAERAALQQQRATEDASREVDDAAQKEAAAAAAKEAARQHSEDARGEIRDAVTDRDRARGAVRTKDAAVSQSQRVAEAAEKAAKGQRADAAKAKAELERLLGLVRRQEEEVGRQERASAEAAAAAEEAKGRVAAARRDRAAADDAATSAQQLVAAAEQQLRAALDSENSHTKLHRDASRSHAHAQARLASEQHSLSSLRSEQQQKAAAVEHVDELLRQHAEVAEELHSKEAAAAARRDQQWRKENTLLCEEVRLQEQRRAVEEKERALHQAHYCFAEEAGRVSSPARGY